MSRSNKKSKIERSTIPPAAAEKKRKKTPVDASPAPQPFIEQPIGFAIAEAHYTVSQGQNFVPANYRRDKKVHNNPDLDGVPEKFHDNLVDQALRHGRKNPVRTIISCVWP